MTEATALVAPLGGDAVLGIGGVDMVSSRVLLDGLGVPLGCEIGSGRGAKGWKLTTLWKEGEEFSAGEDDVGVVGFTFERLLDVLNDARIRISCFELGCGLKHVFKVRTEPAVRVVGFVGKVAGLSAVEAVLLYSSDEVVGAHVLQNVVDDGSESLLWVEEADLFRG